MNSILFSFQQFDSLIGGEAMARIIVVLVIVFLYFFVRYLVKTFFSSNRKKEIYNDLIKIFNGKINQEGYPEFQFKNRKITVQYGFETSMIGGYEEYITTLIDISDIDNQVRKELKSEFDIVHENNKNYIQFNSYWGHRGDKFKERLIEKINKLDTVLNENPKGLSAGRTPLNKEKPLSLPKIILYEKK